MTHIAATSNAVTPADTKRTQSSRQSGASFAMVQAAAVRDAKDKDKDKAKSTDATSTSAPKGERTQKVEGHHYMEIVSGPRNGMFINNSGNSRDGDAFVIVRRHGREFHIYGSGKDRNVYEVGRERAASGTSQGSGTSTTSGTTGQTGTVGAGTPGTTGSTGAGTGTATT
jgi:hypothetical protein